MNVVLFIFVVLIMVFLIVVAAIYIQRPEFALAEMPANGGLTTIIEVDMWIAFMVALIIAMFVSIVAGYGYLRLYCKK